MRGGTSYKKIRLLFNFIPMGHFINIWKCLSQGVNFQTSLVVQI